MKVSQLPVKRGRRCKHVHYSGRRCAALVFEHRFDRCLIHRKADGGNFGTTCEECKAMKRAFPLRRDVESGKSHTP